MTALTAATRDAFRRPSRGQLVIGLLLGWLVLAAILHGHATLPLDQTDTTHLHQQINHLNDSIGDNRNSNPFFTYFINPIRDAINNLFVFIQGLISQPSYGRPVPAIGWLGVVALLTFVAGALGNLRVAALAAIGFTFLGLQGVWQQSMDTLSLTLAAVLISLAVGIPLGIWAGVSDRFNAAITPVLEFMQTMPTFVYLAPLTLFFLIGPASAVIATMIYALPPAIRLTAYGIREVPPASVEASTSLGATTWQRLTTVLLPMSKRTIVLGVNQTIMAALSMVTITALIDGPGLGQTVVQALQTQDVGTSFNAGLAIVLIAIVLDRITTAASQRNELAQRSRSGQASRLRRPLVVVGAIVAVVLVYLSRTYLWAANFPDTATIGGKARDIQIGDNIARITSNVADWVQTNLSGVTDGIKNGVSSALIDPLQNVLTQSPWWLIAVVLIGLAALLGDRRATIITAACVGVLYWTGVWQDAMTTLAMTLIATVVVILLGIMVGVWMARSRAADAIIRPILDAAQTMPAFVYLVPFLALFAASRFTAIAAAIVYAAPISIKIIADGVSAVSPTAIEATTASGSSTWQMITKVQLPMARESLILAANQGLCYVLAMVVVGGLVGAQALGYDVVAGFSQGALYGKGLAAGIAIVVLGIMLNRITQAAARRQHLG
jgi:glycine betaine/proline transport system permease protein